MLATGAKSKESAMPGSSLYGMYMLSLAVHLVGNLVVRLGSRGGWLPSWGQAAVAVVAALPLAASAFVFWRLLRRDVDEMFQRIVLEGMAFALTVYIPIAALYVNLRTAGVSVPRLDAPDLMLAPAILVAIGITIARRRYA